MNYQVFHAQYNDNERMAFNAADAKDWNVPGNYELVANVECNGLEQAYYLTNSIHNYWWENKGVTAKKIATRSTSIGDIIVDNQGQKWVCDTFGFKKYDERKQQSDA